MQHTSKTQSWRCHRPYTQKSQFIIPKKQGEGRRNVTGDRGCTVDTILIDMCKRWVRGMCVGGKTQTVGRGATPAFPRWPARTSTNTVDGSYITCWQKHTG